MTWGNRAVMRYIEKFSRVRQWKKGGGLRCFELVPRIFLSQTLDVKSWWV